MKLPSLGSLAVISALAAATAPTCAQSASLPQENNTLSCVEADANNTLDLINFLLSCEPHRIKEIVYQTSKNITRVTFIQDTSQPNVSLSFCITDPNQAIDFYRQALQQKIKILVVMERALDCDSQVREISENTE